MRKAKVAQFAGVTLLFASLFVNFTLFSRPTGHTSTVEVEDDEASPESRLLVQEEEPMPAAVPQRAALPAPGVNTGQFAELFTVDAEASRETLWKCVTYGAWSDVCVYRRLCFKVWRYRADNLVCSGVHLLHFVWLCAEPH